MSRSRPDETEGERGETLGVLKEVGEISIALKRNAVELVAHSEIDGQIRQHLPTVLRIGGIFVLHVHAVVDRGASARLVEELRLGCAIDQTEQAAREILELRAAAIVPGVDVAGIIRIEVHDGQIVRTEDIETVCGSRTERVITVLEHVAEFAAELHGVLTFDDGEAIGHVVRAGTAALAVAIAENAATNGGNAGKSEIRTGAEGIDEAERIEGTRAAAREERVGPVHARPELVHHVRRERGDQAGGDAMRLLVASDGP